MSGAELDAALLTAAWLTGLAGGSGHCLAMCGGILAAFGTGQRTGWRGFGILLCAHCGRVLGYAAAGALVGALGGGIAAGLLGDHGAAALRYIAAALIALIGLQLLLGRPLLGRLERLGGRLWLRLAPAARALWPPRTPARALAAGMLWGWLPCGLVYAQLAVAAASGGLVSGALAMTFFGFGTLIGLSALSALLHAAGLARLPNAVSGALLILFAAWTAYPVLQRTGEHMH